MPYTTNPVFPFPHNWDKELLETLEWKTDVLVGETGKEQRVSRRLTPRRSFEATFLLEKEALQFFENFMAMYGGSVMVIPLWHAVTRLTGDMSIGSNMMDVDTVNRGFAVGDFAILRGSMPAVWGTQPVTTVGSTTVGLASGIEGTWPQGTFVYPGVLARVEESTKVTKITDTAGEVTVRFSVEQENYHASDWTPAYFEGELVYDTPPDDSEELSSENQRLVSVVDNSIGRPATYDMAGVQLKTYSYLWSVNGVAKLAQLKKLLYWLRGRTRSVWLPTFREDLKLISNTTTGGTSLTVKNVGYTRFSMHTRKRDAVRIQMWDGTVYYRRITGGAEYDGYTEVLSVNIAWPVGFTPNEVARISYLVNVRLDQDKLEFKHPTDIEGITQCEVTWKELAGVLDTVEFLGYGGNAVTQTNNIAPSITVYFTPDVYPEAYPERDYIYNPLVNEFWVAAYQADSAWGLTRMDASSGAIVAQVDLGATIEANSIFYNEYRQEVYIDWGLPPNYPIGGYEAAWASPQKLNPYTGLIESPLGTFDFPGGGSVAVEHGWPWGSIFDSITVSPTSHEVVSVGLVHWHPDGYTLGYQQVSDFKLLDPVGSPTPPDPKVMGTIRSANGFVMTQLFDTRGVMWDALTKDGDTAIAPRDSLIRRYVNGAGDHVYVESYSSLIAEEYVITSDHGYIDTLTHIPDRDCVWCMFTAFTDSSGSSTFTRIYEFHLTKKIVTRVFNMPSAPLLKSWYGGRMAYDADNQVMWYQSIESEIVGVRISNGSIFKIIDLNTAEVQAYDLGKITVLDGALWVQSVYAYNPDIGDYQAAMIKITHEVICP